MSRFAILLLLLVLGLVAAAVLRSRAPAAYRGLSLMTMNILIAAALLELVAGGILKLLPAAPAAFLADRANAESTTYFADKPWAAAFWREHWPALTRHAFRPFALWEGGVSTGQYVNVGTDHRRLTPASRCEPSSVRVFVFGGSTIWGWGAPDSGTIPARLQSALAGRSVPTCVENFGQLGYVTTQELITLQQQLQAGNVPDLAVFYDGFNDCLPVQMGFGPGGHWTQDDIERRLMAVTTANPAGQLLRSTYTFRLATRLRQRLGGRPPKPSGTWTPPVARLHPDSIDALADAAAKVYLANSRGVAALARGFGFEYAIFIQPWTGTTQRPERWGPLRGTVMADSGMCGKYFARIRAAAGHEPHLYDLSDTFDTTSASVYIDRVHLTPDGNDQIARRISGILTAGSGMLRRHAPDPSRSSP